MDPRDEFFQNVFDQNGRGAAETKFQRQLSFEDRCVRRIFRECGIAAPLGQFVRLCRDQTGYPELSFNWFQRQFDFPAHLGGKRITYVGKRNNESLYLYQLSIVDLFNTRAATSNLLVRAISKAMWASDMDSERPFIFMFPIVRKMFCAHNLDLVKPDAAHSDKPCMRAQFTLEKFRMTIEPSESLFAGWNNWYPFC